MRRVSIYQQAISGSPASTGSGGGVLRRPLSSQRPPSSAGAGGFADALLQAYRTPTGSNATQSHEGPLQSTTPTKRAKRDGAAMTEFRRAVAREMSEYNMWWHCMQDDTTASSLVCSRPAESIRVVLTGIKPLVPLTLYHGSAEVEQVTGFLDKPVGVGQTPSTGATFSRDSDSDVATVIQKLIKQRNESILSFKEGGRDDLAQAEEADLALLKEYLPKQLSDEEILEKVRGVVEKLGVKGIKAMGTVMKEVGIGSDQAPKSKVAEAVKKVLSE
ncbi:hypothetical protein GGI07_002559 [Coemansia sp. Benny D115]|nr:hypothetical protein GGI07_002559 [Coemansia sp. Benny D115]